MFLFSDFILFFVGVAKMLKANKQYGSSSSSAFAQQSSQSSSSNSGASASGAADQPNFTSICQLANNAASGKQSVVLKLTDECSEAVKRAIRARLPIRMHLRKEVGKQTIRGTEF